MKKLMIAATLAALTAGAYAEAEKEYVYDFTASVKSTGGKSGKKVSYTVNCGRNAEGEWWWEAAGYEDDDEAKAAVKEMDDIEKKELAEQLDFDGKKTAYNLKNQQGKWCTTFKYTEDGICYRVAKSYKIKDTFIGGCCGDFESILALVNDDVEDTGATLAAEFIQRFGAQTLGKANKVEILADVAGTDAVAGEYEAKIAGQGTWKNDAIYSLSGNIVGKKVAPVCPGCCGDDVNAFAFDCTAEADLDAADDLDTAIFGSWTLKYNKKLTADANN